MHILVIGSKGQLGWELVTRAESWGFKATGYDLPELDITQSFAVRRVVLDSGSSVVVNAAAYTAVDQAEEDRDQAYAVNCSGAVNLAEACRDASVPLIHLSTDYVFNGESRVPYKEADPVSPLGVYGHSKLAGEQRIRALLETYMIVRTSWLCGFQGSNFVKTMLRLGKERSEIRVVADQYGCPTFAGDLAEGLFQVISSLREKAHFGSGIYHLCGAGVASWYEFAVEIFSLARQYDSFPVEVVPIQTAEYPTPAARPAYSVLDCERIKTEFGVSLRPWKEGLADLVERLFK